jgi:WD40-like Beta Propeller Repeat
MTQPVGAISHSYLHDGRLTYVTEHINPGQSWTDVWAVTPGNTQAPDALLQDVQVQGPFEFSPDGQRLAFSSPRNGSFDVYVATLDASGAEALKKLSAETELAPALAAAGHPVAASASGQPTAVATGPGAAQPGAQPQAYPATAQAPPGGLVLSGVSPYVAALAALAMVWASVEAVMIVRRKMRGK